MTFQKKNQNVLNTVIVSVIAEVSVLSLLVLLVSYDQGSFIQPIFTGVFIATFSICMAQGRVKASRNLHEHLLIKILRCPMSFFDTTPLGRIINRFSRDVDTVDVLIPGNLEFWLYNIFGVIATIIMV